MKFSMTRSVKIVMLGAGGTGGHIAPHLYRLLYALNRPVRFIICDGDIVEQKNLVRQNFIPADLGENKAQVLAERYSTVFGMETEYVPSFIESEETLKELIKPRVTYSGCYPRTVVDKELVILIGAVDNNRSRQMCHRVFYEAEELIYIDSGNSEHTGQVVCGIRSGGRTLYKPVGKLYPEVLKETDKFPTELSCAEASISAPQAMTANITAATAVVDMIYNILTLGESRVRQVTFATTSCNVRPVLARQRRKIAA
jgi:PRTRC genetic system ThiF family protein